MLLRLSMTSRDRDGQWIWPGEHGFHVADVPPMS